MDSGTSKHFTMKMDDFSSYKSIPASNKNKVITANGKTFIEGKGTVFIQHNVERNSCRPKQQITCLSPIYFISGLSSWLMSMGEFLHSVLEVQGSTESLELIKKHDKVVMQCLPMHCKGNLTIEHNTQILARGIQRENSKDSPSKGGLHKEQSA